MNLAKKSREKQRKSIFGVVLQSNCFPVQMLSSLIFSLYSQNMCEIWGPRGCWAEICPKSEAASVIRYTYTHIWLWSLTRNTYTYIWLSSVTSVAPAKSKDTAKSKTFHLLLFSRSAGRRRLRPPADETPVAPAGWAPAEDVGVDAVPWPIHALVTKVVHGYNLGAEAQRPQGVDAEADAAAVEEVVAAKRGSLTAGFTSL